MSLETLSYLKYTMAGVLTDTVTDVLSLRREEGTTMTMIDGVAHVIKTLRFHLDASSLPAGFRVRLKDQLLDADGAKWTIVGHKLATLRTRWAVDTQGKA